MSPDTFEVIDGYDEPTFVPADPSAENARTLADLTGLNYAACLRIVLSGVEV